MVFVAIPSRHRTQWRWATPLLVAMLTGVWLWLTLMHDEPSARALMQRWGTLTGSVAHWREALRDARLFTLLSALFIHAGPVHLLGNVLFLLIFGLPAERTLGAWRFLLLFALGGALANLLAAILMGQPGRVIVGASGGVSAVIGAYLALFPGARLGIVLPLGLWLEFVRAPAALLIGLWATLQLIFTFVGPRFGAVAWWAHLGGFVLGALFALVLRPALARRARR